MLCRLRRIVYVVSGCVGKLETDVGNDRTCASCGDGGFWTRVVGQDAGSQAEGVEDSRRDGEVQQTKCTVSEVGLYGGSIGVELKMHLRNDVLPGLTDEGGGGRIRGNFHDFFGGRGHGGTGALLN